MWSIFSYTIARKTRCIANIELANYVHHFYISINVEKRHIVGKQSHKSECCKQTCGSWISWLVRIVQFSH